MKLHLVQKHFSCKWQKSTQMGLGRKAGDADKQEPRDLGLGKGTMQHSL